MRHYYRVMLGKKSAHAKECFAGGFVGSGFGNVQRDLAAEFPNDWRAFNHKFIPELEVMWPERSRIGLGLWCGATWTICKGVRTGDIILSPDGQGTYHVGEVTGDYVYASGGVLPHRRAVHWFANSIARADMSESLRNSAGSIGTVSDISGYREELELLIGGVSLPTVVATDPTVEDAASFVLEKHLEDFLVKNWSQTELGKQYDIYCEDGEVIGQQYLTDTGPLDVLAVSKDKKTLLVVELKKGRASDVVVGQVLRYMGYVHGELAENGQAVRGVIIALEDDQRIRRALSMTPTIDFYRYEISFKLVKG